MLAIELGKETEHWLPLTRKLSYFQPKTHYGTGDILQNDFKICYLKLWQLHQKIKLKEQEYLREVEIALVLPATCKHLVFKYKSKRDFILKFRYGQKLCQYSTILPFHWLGNALPRLCQQRCPLPAWDERGWGAAGCGSTAIPGTKDPASATTSWTSDVDELLSNPVTWPNLFETQTAWIRLEHQENYFNFLFFSTCIWAPHS